ncbi:MAG TPA: hypothetical protein VF458_24200 [Ktedonobacteraceae bacterium]
MNRRGLRFQTVHERTSQNMRAIQGQSKREAYWRGIGQGSAFFLLGSVVMGLNLQKAGAGSLFGAFQALPTWVWVIGGGLCSFGISWAIYNLLLLIALVRASKQVSEDGNLPGESTN